MTDKSLDEWMDDDVPDLMHDATGERVPAPQFTIDNLNKLDWALRKIRTLVAQIADRNAQADAWIARVEEWRRSANNADAARGQQLEAMCEAFHRRQIEAARDRGLPERQWPKTITAPHGKLTSTAGRESVVVVDEDALREWAHKSAVDVWGEPKLLTTKLREQTDVKVEAGRRVLVFMGEVVPGVHVEVGDRSYKVKPFEPDTVKAVADALKGWCPLHHLPTGPAPARDCPECRAEIDRAVHADTASADHAETQALDDPIRAEANAGRDVEQP